MSSRGLRVKYLGKFRLVSGTFVEGKVASLMSFGGFLENKSGSGSARNDVSDIPYNDVTTTNHTNNNNDDRMPFGAISQPRLVTTTPTLAKSMFNSPGLSLALVRDLVTLLYNLTCWYHVVLCFLISFPFLFAKNKQKAAN